MARSTMQGHHLAAALECQAFNIKFIGSQLVKLQAKEVW